MDLRIVHEDRWVVYHGTERLQGFRTKALAQAFMAAVQADGLMSALGLDY